MTQFERTLAERNTKIRSVCRLCGWVRIASVSEGLARFETEHERSCSARSDKGFPAESAPKWSLNE